MLLCLVACNKITDDHTKNIIQLTYIKVGEINLKPGENTQVIPVNPSFNLKFSAALDSLSVVKSIKLYSADQTNELEFSFADDIKKIQITAKKPLENETYHTFEISNTLTGKNGERFDGASFYFTTEKQKLQLVSLSVNGISMIDAHLPRNIPFDSLRIEAVFSSPITDFQASEHISFTPFVACVANLSEDKTKLQIQNIAPLDYYQSYHIRFTDNIQAADGSHFDGFTGVFHTGLDPSLKFPLMDDQALLDLVQQQTLKYFFDFAHPISYMARERSTSGDLVTTGGSGFGLMALICGIERGWIERHDAIERFDKLTDFLQQADRFHGAWPHWMNGATGKVYPFSRYDDGADLVETSFMAAGLISLRQYLNAGNQKEAEIIERINQMLDEIEWNWFTRDGQKVLYWHWSPTHQWAINLPIKGYNEALITYIIAASSVKFGIEPEVYHQGWADNGAITNGKSFYDIVLPLGVDYGGPLFFSHYSFLGLDPRELTDTYGNYWEQNQHHSLINRSYCIHNPHDFIGYDAQCWGLTASDEPTGYGVHEPRYDNGTISPTATLSSMPYTPEYSLQALRHFYFIVGDKVWGQYGFKDAFNPTEAWWSNTYLAIDQGPVVVMIENYRSGLIWELFMSAPEIQQALSKLGFSIRNKNSS